MSTEMNVAQVSPQLLKVFGVLAGVDAYVTSNYVANLAGCANRTARAHLHRLTAQRVVACEPLFPEYRYRLIDTPQRRAFAARMAKAARAMGEA